MAVRKKSAWNLHVKATMKKHGLKFGKEALQKASSTWNKSGAKSRKSGRRNGNGGQKGGSGHSHTVAEGASHLHEGMGFGDKKLEGMDSGDEPEGYAGKGGVAGAAEEMVGGRRRKGRKNNKRNSKRRNSKRRNSKRRNSRRRNSRRRQRGGASCAATAAPVSSDGNGGSQEAFDDANGGVDTASSF